MTCERCGQDHLVTGVAPAEIPEEWCRGALMQEVMRLHGLLRKRTDDRIADGERWALIADKERERAEKSDLQNGELRKHLKYASMIAERLGPRASSTHREEALALLDGTLRDAREVTDKRVEDVPHAPSCRCDNCKRFS